MWTRAKNLARRVSPTLYENARGARDRLQVEIRVLKQVGLRGLFAPMLDRRSAWRTELPVQSVSRFEIEWQGPADSDFLEVARRTFGDVTHGQHTVYLGPPELSQGPFSVLAGAYPSPWGLKVIRAPGDSASAGYLFGESHSQIQRALLHDPRTMLLAANRLHGAGLGPRYYDVVELNLAGQRWTAFAVEHCDQNLDPDAAKACVEGLRRLVADGEMNLVVPGGFDHPDFLAPAYGANVRRSSSGRAVYVDTQNFSVGDHGRYLRRLAAAAAADTHFGETSVLRGGRYLYQKVPGTGLPAKRTVTSRFAVFDRLLADAGLSISGRVVIDYGCNVGMTIAEYLRRNALWAVGFDMEATTKHAERLLLGIGCTRFSLVGGPLAPTTDTIGRLPAFVSGHLSGSIISYLAVRGHFSWLNDLANTRDLGWSFMLYEGHEGETAQETNEYLQRLNSMVPIQVLGTSEVRDGDSRPRVAALVQRIV